MVLLRLGLLRKKVLMLVNSIDAGFRLRLFLETFGVRSAVLNAELPLNSRHHILQARGVRVRVSAAPLTAAKLTESFTRAGLLVRLRHASCNCLRLASLCLRTGCLRGLLNVAASTVGVSGC